LAQLLPAPLVAAACMLCCTSHWLGTHWCFQIITYACISFQTARYNTIFTVSGSFILLSKDQQTASVLKPAAAPLGVAKAHLRVLQAQTFRDHLTTIQSRARRGFEFVAGWAGWVEQDVRLVRLSVIQTTLNHGRACRKHPDVTRRCW